MAVTEAFGDSTTYWRTPVGNAEVPARDWLKDILDLARMSPVQSGRIMISPDTFQGWMSLFDGDSRVGRFIVEADHIGPTPRIEADIR